MKLYRSDVTPNPTQKNLPLLSLTGCIAPTLLVMQRV